MNYKSYGKNIFLIPLIILITIATCILLSEYRSWPAHDELVSISTFGDIRTIPLKYIPNNHVITSFLGVIFNFFFGVNLITLRFISFISFILIIFYTTKYTKSNLIPLILLSIYLSYDNLIDYSFLFRGYYLSALFFILLFFYTSQIKEKPQKKNKIYFITALLLIHNLSVIYFILPLVLFFIIEDVKEKKNNFVKFFIFPLFIFYSISIPMTGAYQNKQIIFDNAGNYFNLLNFNFLFNIFYDGFYALINPDVVKTSQKINENLKDFYLLLTKNYFALSIFIFSFIKSIYLSITRRNLIDFVILFSFLIFFIHNKLPLERILIPYIYLYAVYSFFDFKFLVKNNYYIYSLKCLIIFFIIFKIFSFNLHSSKQINLVELKFNDDIEKKCILKLKSNIEYDYHYFYFKYLEICKKKPNIIEFYKFYKTRLK